MLRSADILGPIVYVNLLELVAIGQRSARYVHMLLGVLVHAEDQRLSRVVQGSGYLKEEEEVSSGWGRSGGEGGVCAICDSASL